MESKSLKLFSQTLHYLLGSISGEDPDPVGSGDFDLPDPDPGFLKAVGSGSFSTDLDTSNNYLLIYWKNSIFYLKIEK